MRYNQQEIDKKLVNLVLLVIIKKMQETL